VCVFWIKLRLERESSPDQTESSDRNSYSNRYIIVAAPRFFYCSTPQLNRISHKFTLSYHPVTSVRIVGMAITLLEPPSPYLLPLLFFVILFEALLILGKKQRCKPVALNIKALTLRKYELAVAMKGVSARRRRGQDGGHDGVWFWRRGVSYGLHRPPTSTPGLTPQRPIHTPLLR